MNFLDAVKILELNVNKNNFISLSEIEKQYKKLVKIYHPDLYVNDKNKFKWAQEKMRLINEAIEFLRTNYDNIKATYNKKNEEENLKEEAIKKAKENEKRKMQEYEETLKKEFSKNEWEIRRRTILKRQAEEKARKEEEKRREESLKKEENNKIKREKRKEFIKKYKNFFIIIFFIILGILLYLYGNRNATEYNKASGTREIGKYKNFKRDGLWVIYYEDGSYEEKNYKNGVLDKEITRYNSTEIGKEKVSIIDGKKEGKYLEYDFFGNLIAEGFYKNDKLEGTFKRYNDNKVFLEENYKNGILDGKFRVFSDNGKIIIDGLYKEGKREGEWIYNNLENLFSNEFSVDFFLINKEYEYISSLIESEEVFNNRIENYDILNVKGNFKNGLKDGEWRFYSYKEETEGTTTQLKLENKKIILYKENRLIKIISDNVSYINDFGDKVKIETFNENDKLKEKIYYQGHLFREGDSFENKSGKITEFYLSGKVSAKIDWKENIEKLKKTNEEFKLYKGNSKLFYENGNLFAEGEVQEFRDEYSDFSMFRKNKKWRYYNENGILILSGEYKIDYEEDEIWGAWYRTGEWVYYYEDGTNIKAKGYYPHNDETYDSYWEFFNIDGNLEKRIYIKNTDKEIKYYIKYYDAGYIIDEEILNYNFTNSNSTINNQNHFDITDLLYLQDEHDYSHRTSNEIKLLDENDIKRQIGE